MFKVRDFMVRPVVTTTPETPIFDAIRLLASRNLSGLPVVDDQLRLVGLLSEKDVLHLLNEHEDSLEMTVQDLMTANPVSFETTDSLIDLCDCLVQNSFRRVPITEDGRLVGVVSRSDVIQAILKIKRQAAMPIGV